MILLNSKYLKNIPLIILFIIFVLDQGYIYSQCTADAGKDTILCVQPELDSLMLGGNPTAVGTAPFTYEWSAHETYLSYNLYASDFLSDTTSPNPYLFPDPELDGVDLYLKVTDQLGDECYDTVRVRFSSAAYLIITRSAYIDLGDSVQLYTSVTGGIEPISYSWSPTTALSDPNTENPYASPTMDMGYVATLTDSAGCQFSEQDVFQVFVDVSDLSTAENNNFTAFFDYTLNEIKIKNAKNELYRYSIYNSSGAIVAKGETTNTEIVCRNLSPGLYSFKAETKNSNQQYQLKFIVGLPN